MTHWQKTTSSPPPKKGKKMSPATHYSPMVMNQPAQKKTDGVITVNGKKIRYTLITLHWLICTETSELCFRTLFFGYF